MQQRFCRSLWFLSTAAIGVLLLLPITAGDADISDYDEYIKLLQAKAGPEPLPVYSATQQPVSTISLEPTREPAGVPSPSYDMSLLMPHFQDQQEEFRRKYIEQLTGNTAQFQEGQSYPHSQLGQNEQGYSQSQSSAQDEQGYSQYPQYFEQDEQGYLQYFEQDDQGYSQDNVILTDDYDSDVVLYPTQEPTRTNIVPTTSLPPPDDGYDIAADDDGVFEEEEELPLADSVTLNDEDDKVVDEPSSAADVDSVDEVNDIYYFSETVGASQSQNEQQVSQSFQNEQDNSGTCEPATITARFPKGVFNITSLKNEGGIFELKKRCVRTTAFKPDEALACLLLFDLRSSSDAPMVLGTFKLGADLLNTENSNGKFRDINTIFQRHALAEMIHKGCFELDCREDELEMLKEKVTDFKSSMKSFSNKIEFESSTDVEFVKLSLSTAFDSSISESSSTSTNTKTAYAKKYWAKSIGTLTNRCLQKSKMGVIRDLIEPDTITDWELVRSARNIPLDKIMNDTNMSSAFKKVAEGGFVMPRSYKYAASIQYTFEYMFTQKGRTTDDNLDASLEAGLKFGLKDLAKTRGNSVFHSQANGSTELLSGGTYKNLQIRAYGTDLDGSCIEYTNCSEAIAKSVCKVRDNIWNFNGKPFTYSNSILLPTFVKWYFEDADDDDGFPEVFRKYLKENYSYTECIAKKNCYEKNGFGGFVSEGCCNENTEMCMFSIKKDNNSPCRKIGNEPCEGNHQCASKKCNSGTCKPLLIESPSQPPSGPPTMPPTGITKKQIIILGIFFGAVVPSLVIIVYCCYHYRKHCSSSGDSEPEKSVAQLEPLEAAVKLEP